MGRMMHAAVLAACGACALGAAHTSEARFIVTYKDAATHRTFGTLAVEEVGGGAVEVDMPRHHAVAAWLSADGVAAMERDARVERVEIDHRRYLTRVDPSELEPRGAPYGIAMVQADRVREVAGRRKVCIIDSGLDMSHEEWAGNARIGGDDDAASGRWSTDENSHGTHVAGTVFGPRNGRGVVGVNPEGLLDVHVIKTFDGNGWAYSSSLVGALDLCVAAGSDVIQMSLGGPSYSQFEDRAFAEAWARGVLPIAAAGNDGNSQYSYPASYDSVVSVGAVDRDRRHASFSQYNSQVDIAAPGVGVLSTMPRGFGGRYGAYDEMDGTSMACPHVSGVAALVWNNVPDCTAAQVKDAMLRTAVDLGPAGRDIQYGHGLVQAKAMLDALRPVCGSGGGAGPAPVATPVPPAPGVCADVTLAGGEPWHAATNTRTTCAWFAQGGYCERYGGRDYTGPNGMAAREACCVCGGGMGGAQPVPTPPRTSPPAPVPSPTSPPAPAPVPTPPGTCADVTEGGQPWYLLDPSYNCGWFEEDRTRCGGFGQRGYAGWNGMAAVDACCACGGGVKGSAPTPPPPPPGVPTPAPAQCVDGTVGGRTWWTCGPEYTCAWFATDPSYNCAVFGGGKYQGNDGRTAAEACCVCGGGERSGGGAGTGPAPGPPARGVQLSMVGNDGETVSAQSGSITDGYPRYADGVDHVVTVRGENCKVTFTEFDVEYAAGCSYDFVDVEGARGMSHRLCGNSPPAPIQLQGEYFRVHLRSDANAAFAGFVLDFTCEK